MTTDQLDPDPAAAASRPGAPEALLVPAGCRSSSGDGWFFASEALRTFRLTGAVAPSGAGLVDALVVPATSRPDRPISVLEVGAGTGPVTRRLVQVLRAGDQLHVVEPNPRFAQRLRSDAELVRRAPELALRVSACRVQDLPEHRTSDHHGGTRGGAERDGVHGFDDGAGPAVEQYDVIVSGLPFTNFEPAEVRRILDLYLRLLVPGGELTYFGYLGTSAARLLTSGPRRGARHRAVVRLLRRFEEEYGLGSRVVWRNVPPARAHLLRAPGGARPATAASLSDVAAARPRGALPSTDAGADGPAGGVTAAAR
ncbi:class I SAM-dependent methyltransferase [Kitasatospora misakiensis]|uniref:Class I SAM-dependent methyltransferase n=1 Tax=Kitasatospora misakiensis TaxID=67330 RepID=A0ABW0WYX7_9ACTN